MLMGKRKKSERGSAAIEAVVCLTVFMVAIMTILSFINICRAQAAVSAAVDAAAKELSQYAYFYHLCGLDELQNKTLDSVKEDREKLEDIAGGTQAMYKIFQTFGSDELTSDDIVKLAEGTAAEIAGEPSPTDGVARTPVTMQNAAGKINQMISAAASIKDPMQFLKSVVTIGAMEGTSFLRSQLIAAPLARILAEKHFQIDGMDADTYLRTLNIEGMDALNFKMSTIFAPAAPNDIHLVCYYQMKPVRFFNFDFGTITLCKESCTRAWLGGDREYLADEGRKDGSGIWDMGSLQYGKYIVNAEKEKLLKQGCYDAEGSGADVFRQDSNTWIHVRSMDVYSDSYRDSPETVRNILYSEYSKLSSAAQSSSGTVSVKDGEEKKELASPADTRKIHMVIVIPEGEKPEAFQEGLALFQQKIQGDDTFTFEVKQGYGTSPKNRKEEGTRTGEEGST